MLCKRDSVFRYLLIPLFPDHYQAEDKLRWNDNFFHVRLSSTQSQRTQRAIIIVYSQFLLRICGDFLRAGTFQADIHDEK